MTVNYIHRDLPPRWLHRSDVESFLRKELMNEEEPFSEDQIIGMFKEQDAGLQISSTTLAEV